jgi:phosphate-selective porin OprO/OprP
VCSSDLNEMRRIRLGGEGKLGSGFGYKLELELSDNAVDLVDTFVTWEKGPWQIAIGNQNQFQSLDELIGDTTGSVMERAAFTDAFDFERRLGIAVQYRRDALLLQAGLFSDDIDALSNASDGPDGGDENNSFSLDGRAVYAPKAGGIQLHFGGSAHLRRLNRLAETPIRYRQRPYLHGSNSRPLATPGLRVDRELHYGLELAAVRGRWHMAGETHWLEAIGPGPDRRFFGGYAEIGWYLTDDSRPYRNGIFGGAKPSSPLGKGGIGAVQLNLRYDYLDLDSGPVRGGRQNAIIAGLVWTPIEYLRFNLNHAYLAYDGAAIPAAGRRDYGLHVTGARMELDF